MPPRGSNVNNSARKSTSGGRRNTANDTSTTAPPDTTPTSSSGIPPRPPLGTARAGVNNVGTSNDTAAEVAALRGKSLSNSKPRHSPFHAASLEKAQADLQKANQTIATINTPVANAGRGRANNEEQIPKPKGTAGERGGFNLQAEMGLGDDKEQYNTIMVRWHLCSCVSGFTLTFVYVQHVFSIKRSVRDLVHNARLDLSTTYGKQSPETLGRLFRVVSGCCQLLFCAVHADEHSDRPARRIRA